MPEEEMVQAPVGAEEEKVPETTEEAEEAGDLKVVVEELQDLVAEIVDVVDKLAESINAVKTAKEEIAEALKGLKTEIEVIKAELPKLNEGQIEEEKRRAENYPEGKEPQATETGEEVEVTGERIAELAPKVESINTERPVVVEKGVVEDEDIVSKILREGAGIADLIRIEKSLVKKR